MRIQIYNTIQCIHYKLLNRIIKIYTLKAPSRTRYTNKLKYKTCIGLQCTVKTTAVRSIHKNRLDSIGESIFFQFLFSIVAFKTLTFHKVV